MKLSMKIILFLFACVGSFFVSFASIAQEFPAYEGDIQQWEEVMLEYATDWKNFSGKNKQDIKKLRDEFNEILIQNPDRPRLWIVLGQLYRQEISPILSELKKSGMSRKERKNNPEYLEAIGKVNESFKKAMDLNDGRLSLSELTHINTVITKADIKVKNLREMIRLWDDGKRFDDLGNDPVIDFDYKALSHIVTAYVDEKRYDEALSVINEIEEKFPSMQSEIESGRQRIWGFQQAAQVVQAEQEDTPQTTEPKEPELAIATSQQQSVQQQPVVKAEDTPQKLKTKPEANNNQVIIVGIVLVILVLVGFMVARRKPK